MNFVRRNEKFKTISSISRTNEITSFSKQELYVCIAVFVRFALKWTWLEFENSQILYKSIRWDILIPFNEFALRLRAKNNIKIKIAKDQIIFEMRTKNIINKILNVKEMKKDFSRFEPNAKHWMDFTWNSGANTLFHSQTMMDRG